MRHFPGYIFECLFDNSPEKRFLRHLVGVQVQRHQLGVVVEHLFEMRHQPFVVDRVAGETAPKLVVDASTRHLFERKRDDIEDLPAAGALPVAQ